jgi:histidinol-phosphatase
MLDAEFVADDLAMALALADIADDITMSRYLASDLQVQTKPDRTPVTEADRGVEEALARHLGVHLPDDGLVGEEFGDSVGRSGRTWIIDPIDGTANFLRGVPVWATLIALVVGEVPTVGVVSAPAMGRRWWAAPGTCATSDVDGRQRALRVSAVAAYEDASLAYSDPIGWPAGSLGRLQQRAWRSRGYGDFWSHVLVAEGAVDVAVEPDLKPWDVAALLPILTQAGGQHTGTSGQQVLVNQDGQWQVPAGLVSSNGRLHHEALRLIAE